MVYRFEGQFESPSLGFDTFIVGLGTEKRGKRRESQAKPRATRHELPAMRCNQRSQMATSERSKNMKPSLSGRSDPGIRPPTTAVKPCTTNAIPGSPRTQLTARHRGYGTATPGSYQNCCAKTAQGESRKLGPPIKNPNPKYPKNSKRRFHRAFQRPHFQKQADEAKTVKSKTGASTRGVTHASSICLERLETRSAFI